MKKLKKGRMFFCIILMIMVSSVVGIRTEAKNADTWISEDSKKYCEEIGKAYSICPELLEAIMESESSGNTMAVNGNCKGLMQINERWHTERMGELGVTDLYDAKSNILLAADYLAELFAQYEDIGTVLMVYNGSSDAMERAERADYTEYAKKIIKRSEQLERIHGK